jgi:hypothetical protein
MKFARSLLAATLALALSAAGAFATELYKTGDAFVPFTTKDQHEKDYVFAPGPRLVIVSFEMAEGKAANAFFAEKGAAFLDEQKAVFVANIYGMPAVGRFFALPKMKRYPHRILLADAETFLERYPREENKLTVLRLDPAGAVTGIEFIAPEKGLPALFAK